MSTTKRMCMRANLLRPLKIGVYTLPGLVVTLAVFGGASLIARGLGDQAAAVFLSRIALVDALLLVINLVLLVGMLGVRAVQEADSDHHAES
jgi:hypothetical protein